MRIRIHPEAIAEAEAAVDWYRERSHRAAEEFLSSLRLTLTQVSRDPLRFPRYSPRTRKALMGRFPYIVVFHCSEMEVGVVAVAHGRRKPGYWRERMQ